MRKHPFLRFNFLLLAALLIASACRKEEPLPTPLPTAIVPETIEPVSAATPTPKPTAVPEAGPVINPEDIDWPPQVIYTSPAMGEEATLNGAITIRFDQPMDQESVERAFELEPAASGSFSWPRPDTVIFTPRSDLKRQQTYNLRLAETAKSANGMALQDAANFQLQTVGYLEVSQVIPGDGVSGVQTDGAITVLFNRPVVPLVSSGQQANLPQPLTIKPAVTGKGEWVSTSIYRFVPDEGFAGATTYSVTVAAGLEDVVGGVLADAYTWQFTTLQPSVVSIEPSNAATQVDPEGPITITFNMPMDRSSTETAVSLRTQSSTASLNYEWSDNDRVLTITPRQILELESNYQVGVSVSARSANGSASLDKDTISGFTTVPFPAVSSTQPSQGQTADRWQNGVYLEFASPMDWDTIDGRIQIDPEPDRLNYNFFGVDSSSMSLDFRLLENTEYTVTIPGDAADPYGNTLGRDYVLRFRTPEGAPLASFNLPQRISQLSTSFTTQVEIINRNVTNLNLALYNLGLPIALLNDSYNIQDYNPAADPLRSWSLTTDTARGQVGVATQALADDGTLTTGVYLLTLNSPEITDDVRWWQNQRALLIMSDTNIVVKEMFGETHVWVTDLNSGQPVSGRNLVLYNRDGVQVDTAVSDSSGFASFSTQMDDYLRGVLVVSNQPGEVGFGIGSSFWSDGISPWEFGINTNTSAEQPTFAYIFTDRPIYRPGDTIYYKGIVRDAQYGRYNPPSVKELEMDINTANYFNETGLSDSINVTVDPDGTFSGEYVIPEDVALGTYQFLIPNLNYEAFRQFTIAEYRAPEFLINISPSQPELLRGESVDVTLEATYFFGGPATDLNVNYTIYEESYQPEIDGPFYYFGDSGDFYYVDPGFFGGGGSGSLGNYLMDGQGVTDGNGRLTITLPADLLKDVEDGSRRVNIEANVNDLANFPVAARTSVVFHAADTYVGIVPTDYVATAGTTASVDLITVDWDGQPQPNQNVEVVFYQRQWNAVRDAQYNLYYTRWDPVDTEIDRVQVTTNGQGKTQAEFVPPEGGTYLAVATVTDENGRTMTSSTTLWATDISFIAWRSDPREKRMDLVPDKQEYQPGDTAQILVESPFAGPVQAWLTIERGTLIEQRVVTLNSSSEVLSIPITPGYAPNVFVTIAAIKPVAPGSSYPYADIRLGMTELVVSPKQLELNVELTPRNDVFVPRETAVFDIRVTDYQGNPVQADLSVALVDLAVLTLKPDNAPNILEAFYARQPYRSQVGSGLIISGEGLEVEIPLEGGGMGGGGGDFAAEAALGRAAGEEEGVRKDFRDTAYWSAHVTTDANGRATVEIPLPDNLTTWRLSSKAATANSLVGQASTDIVATLPLLLRPQTPRFFTVGDVLQIGTIINNNTSQAIDATVSLEALGLSLDSLSEQTVTIPGNGRTLVQWQATVDDVPFADLTFRVEGGGYSDATKPTFGEGPDQLIPVYRYTGQDVVGTSGLLYSPGRRVEAVLLPEGVDLRRGSVDVTLSPSLGAALIDALEAANRDYAPICAYAATDLLLPNVATAHAIKTLNLDEPALAAELNGLIKGEIAQLEAEVKPDGGWGWCYSSESQPWLTAYALLALTKAEQAGYGVNTAVLDKAVLYLERQLSEPDQLTEAYEINRQAFYLYVLAETGVIVESDAQALVAEHLDLLDPYAKALLVLVFDLNNSDSDNIRTLTSYLSDSAIMSATGAHWEDASRDYRNLNSDVRGTAIVIDALAQAEPSNLMGPNAVRWLMAARTAQYWSTGHETAWSIYALTNWMAATGELEADFDYQLNVNLDTRAEGQFTPANITESESLSIPLSEMIPDDVNFLDFVHGDGTGRLYYTAHLNSFISMANVSAISRGVTVQRAYYNADCDPETETCEPISQIQAGQRVRVELTIVAPNDLLYPVIEDPIPAGAEAIDPNLETSASGLGGQTTRVDDEYRWGYWGWWYFNRIEYRDEKVVFLADFLPAGTYQYTYYLQTNIPGDYQVMPTFAREAFFPEVNGRADGMLFTIFE
ncbi:MAG: Ig-like domain-containing protein [Ardenticatenaceae bacterium]|nr:Ig-like domain-containing protein [Ardenticatenaceae bacterium]